jgi:hypothetical protein
MCRGRRCTRWLLIGLVLLGPAVAGAQSPLSGEQIRIARAAGTITVDGQLGDEGWRGAQPVEKWYETNPGDNVQPGVRSVGYLAYDDRFFYAAFEFDDPNPSAIRAPFSDRDNISGNATDYGGIIVDTRNDGHSGVLLLATPRGIQYDASTDDAAGEDSSPDYFWNAAARITERGWTLEISVPFSSLRYRSADPQTWGLMLYRNYPREFRYQFFSMKIPRGGNCFVCRANTLVGLEGLPSGGHVVAAPYVSASSEARPEGALGSRLAPADARVRGGLDVKWTPDADNALDFTIKPDFSQIESDTAQISTNERFALFFPEKRTFFLEGVQLLSTPIQAAYTRTITAPRWGSRLTGKAGGVNYTALFADDGGGGSLVIPGSDGSLLVPQASGSYALIARAKRDIGRSFVGVLVTDREAHDGDGHNRVAGADLQWRPGGRDTVTGQWLFSHTTTPDRPDLAAEWTGQSLAGHAASLDWNRNTLHLDFGVGYKNVDEDFRADAGFVPQVGYRQTSHNAGWTMRPDGFVRRVRIFLDSDRQVDRHGDLIARTVAPGLAMDVRFNGFLQARVIDDRVRAAGTTFGRRQLAYTLRFSPSRRLAQISMDGRFGDEVDFANARLGRGVTLNVDARINATNHLELALVQNERWLDVATAAASGRLFTARVSRVRGTYNFTAKAFARVIGQYVSTVRDPALHGLTVTPRSGAFSGSALISYKLNWQSVLFAGYGDDRELSDRHELEKTSRQFFVKLSYALQR